jgi:hypothetical protein
VGKIREEAEDLANRIRLISLYAERVNAIESALRARDERAAKIADNYETNTGDPAYDTGGDSASVTIAEAIRNGG